MPKKGQKQLTSLRHSPWRRQRQLHKGARQSYWQHLALALLLVVSNGAAILINGQSGKSYASSTPVAITYPTENSELPAGTATIRGTAGAGKHVSLFADDIYLGNVDANSDGEWSYRWNNPSAGRHNFRAKVVDGITSTGSLMGAHSINKYSTNSGDLISRNETGFSFISDSVIDTSQHLQFALNAGTGIVSVIDTNTNSHVSDIDTGMHSQTYGGAEPDVRGARLALDETTHKLFVLGFSGHVLIIDTSTQTLATTLTLTKSDNYYMMITPDHSQVFVYGDAKLFKIDVATNAITEQPVSTPFPELHDRTPSALYDPNTDLLYYVPSGTSPTINRVVSADGTDPGHFSLDDSLNANKITDFALSSDYSKLYVMYTTDLGANTHIKSFLTSDLSEVATLDDIDNGSQFLSKLGIGDNLYLANTSESLSAINTSSDAIGSVAGVEGTPSFMSAQLTQDEYYNTLSVDTGNNVLYFVAVDSFSQESVLHTVDMSTNTVVDTTRYAIDSSFNGAHMIVRDATNNQLYVMPKNRSTAIEVISLSDNSLQSPITTNTTGPSTQIAVEPTSGDVFSIGAGSYIGGVSYLITRVDGHTGATLSQIELPSRSDQPINLLMDASGENLYVVALTNDGTKVYRINAGSNTVDHTFTSLLSLGGSSTLVTGSAMHGDNLYVTIGGVNIGDPVYLAKLNVLTDAVSSTTIANRTTDNQQALNDLRQNQLTLNQPGTSILIALNDKFYSYNTSNLSSVYTVTNPASPYVLSMYLSDDGKKLYIGSLAAAVQSSTLPLAVYTFDLSNSSFVSSIALLPGAAVTPGNAFFGTVTGLEMAPSGKTLYAHVNYAFAIASPNLNGVEIRSSIVAVDIKSRAAILNTSVGNGNIANDIAGILYPSNFEQFDDSTEAEVNLTIISDDIIILTPTDASTITSNSPTISGRAPAGKNIRVDIDGTVVGTTISNSSNQWSIQASGVRVGTHTIHASYSRPSRDVVIASNSSLMNILLGTAGLPAVSQPAAIDVFNTESKEVDGKMPIPDDMLPYFTSLSGNGRFVLVFGVTNASQLYTSSSPNIGFGFWLLDTTTNRIVKSVLSDSGFASTFFNSIGGLGSDQLMSMRLSADGSKMYLVSGRKILVVNTEKFFAQQADYLETEIALPGSAVSSQIIAFGTFTSKLFDNGNKMITVNSTGHGLHIVDLNTQQISTIDDQANGIREIVVNEARREAYAIGSNSDLTSGYELYTVNLDTHQITNTITSQVGSMAIAAVVSSDNTKLYIAQYQTDGDTTNVSTVQLDSHTTSESTPTAYPNFRSNPLQSSVLGMLPRNPFYPFSLGNNSSRSDQYIPSMFYGLTHGQFSSGKVFSEDPLDQQYNADHAYMNMSDEFSGTLPAAVLSHQTTFTLARTTITLPPKVNPGGSFVPLPVVPYTGTTKRAGAVVPHKAIKANKIVSLLDRVKYFLTNLGRRMPRGLLNIMPYLLLLLLLAAILTYLYQTRQELKHDKRTREHLAYHTMLATEKTNFLELVSHYLRTPLTVLSGGIEMGKTVTDPAIQASMEKDMMVLNKTAEALLTNVENDTTMQQLETEPILQVSRKEILKNKFFYIPAIALVAILSLFYLLFFIVGHASVNFINLMVQLVASGLSLQLLYNATRNKTVIYHENKRLDALDAFEKKLDSMRAEFIHEAQYTLVYTLNKIQESVTSIPNEQFRGYAQKGIAQLQELIGSFQLVSQLASSKLEGTVQPTRVKNVVEQAVAGVKEDARVRGVTVLIEGLETDPELEIEPSLLILTVKALASNAIDASPAGSQVTLKCSIRDNNVAIQVIDHGRGLTSEQLETAFKPFGRVEDVDDFDKAGLGLGLFTGKMFAHAFKGELNLESVANKGTIASLTLPLSKVKATA